MRGWLAHVTLWPPGRLTAHSLSLFIFQCFLALLVVLVETRDACTYMRGWLAHVTLWPPGRLTAHSLSLFLFQCFLALLVVLVETRDACACTRGFSASRFCKDKCYFAGITHCVLTAYRTRTRPVLRTSMSGGSRETSLPDMTAWPFDWSGHTRLVRRLAS